MVMVDASTFIVQLAGMPAILAATLTGTCMPDSVTMALTLPWLLSRATEKSRIDGAAALVALADSVQTITWVMHSSKNTVPGGAMLAVSIVVRLLTTGPSLENELSLMRRPTALSITEPVGSTWAVLPSP